MPSKKSTILFLLIILIPFLGRSQKISFEANTVLKLKHEINKLHETYVLEHQLVLLGDTRKKNDLDVLLLVLDLDGNLIKEHLIGAIGSYEKPIALCESKTGYQLLINAVGARGKKLVLYHLNKKFEILDQTDILINKLEFGTAMIYNKEKESILIAASIIDELANIFPIIIEYDLKTKMKTSSLELSEQNDKDLHNSIDTYTLFKTDSLGNLVKSGKIKQENKETLLKNCNQIIALDDQGKEVLLIGVENTTTITDFWVAKLIENKLIWERIYKTEIGGDEAFDVFIAGEDKYLVTGLEYTKNISINYRYKTLCLNEKGEVLHSNDYKKKTRSIYKKTKAIGKQFLILGQSENVIYPKTLQEQEQITSSDIYLVLLNENGVKENDFLYETDQLAEVLNLAILPNNKILVVYQSQGVLKLLTLNYQ